MNISDEGTIREYYDTRKQIATFTEDVQFIMSHPNYSLPYIQPGRFVHIKHKNIDFGWGIVVNYKERKPQKNPQGEINDHQKYVVDVLLKLAEGSSVGTKTFEDLPAGAIPPKDGENYRMEVVPVMLTCVQAIGHIRVHLPKELHSLDSRNSMKKTHKEVQRRFPDGVPVLDPIENMNIQDEQFKKNLRVRKPLNHVQRCRILLTENAENRSSRISSSC